MKMPQPSSRNCFVCGVENPVGLKLRFFETAQSEVVAECLLTDEYQGYPGIVHGGVIAAMLDEAAGRSHMGSAESPRFMFTARMEIRYRKSVPIGEPLRLVGRANGRKGRTARATSAIVDLQGEILAEAEVLLILVPEGTIQNSNLEALGWKIYPQIE